jgi:hygromycin-B 7''-O-kinase
MRMPNPATLDEYRGIYHRDDLWRPAVEHICRRHGLPGGPHLRGPDGTHILYFAGESRVVKMFVPLFGDDFTAERLVCERLEGRLGVATPALVGEGEVDGWRYLVMTRVPGRPVGEVWAEMSREDRLGVAACMGDMISALRSVPVEGLDPIEVDWSAFLSEQARTAAVRQRGSGLSWDPAEQIREYLECSRGVLSEAFGPVLVLADITDEHVMVSETGGGWQMVGYVDFGDAMVGHPDYELVAPGLDIARGDPDILRTLLVASGCSERTLDDTLRRRLMSYTLLHRYVKLEYALGAIPEAGGARDIEELARVLWPLC